MLFNIFKYRRMFENYWILQQLYKELFDKELQESLSFYKARLQKLNVENRSVCGWDSRDLIKDLQLDKLSSEFFEELSKITKIPSPEEKTIRVGLSARECYASLSLGIYAQNMKNWKNGAKEEFFSRIKTDKDFKERALLYLDNDKKIHIRGLNYA